MTVLAGLGGLYSTATHGNKGRDEVEPDTRTDDEKIDAGIALLATTKSGRELAELLQRRREDIVVLDNDDPKLPEGAGGRWDPHAGKLYMRRDQLDETGWETLLAHEAQHMRSAGGVTATALRSLRSVGRGILDMAIAPFQLHNPVTAAVDGVRGAFQIDEEAEAYHVQAQVAQELELHADFLQHADHSPRSTDELRRWLLDQPLYAQPPILRAAVGTGFAYLLGRAGSDLVNRGIRHVAPQSWLGRHPIAVTVGGLAVGAALLVQDQLAHRD
jgi:hypothetical protein